MILVTGLKTGLTNTALVQRMKLLFLLSLVQGYKKWKKYCYSPIVFRSRRRGQKQVYGPIASQISMAQSGIILMMLEGGLIFILLVLEVLAGKKNQGGQMDRVTPV